MCLYASSEHSDHPKQQCFVGARSKEQCDTDHTSEHVFKPGCIVSARIHNIMCTAQVRETVSARNSRIVEMMKKTFQCSLHNTLLLDDCMFAHSILLENFPDIILKAHSITNLNINSVRDFDS